MMRETFQAQSYLIDFGFDSLPDVTWQSKKSAIKSRVINLKSGAHRSYQGLRTRGCRPRDISCSDSWIAVSNAGANSSRSSTKSSNHS